MSVADILTTKGHEVVKIRTTDPISTAIQQMTEHRIGAVVVEDTWMHPAGIFTERDFLYAVGRDGAEILGHPVEKHMTTPLVTCLPTDQIEQVMAMMTRKRIRHMPVAQDGKLLGLVSIGDLVKHRLDEKVLEAEVLKDIARMRT